MNDAEILQAALLALTAQNVTGEKGIRYNAVYGPYAVSTKGRVEELSPVYGDYESA